MGPTPLRNNRGTFLEICVYNVSSGLIAAKAGADRIELCDGPDVGGTTPDLEWYLDLRRHQEVDGTLINVMIRPRGGDFVYSDDEFEVMQRDIRKFKDDLRQDDGLVFGILDASGRFDEARNRELVQLAAPAKCTFHRAFDSIALEAVVSTIDLVAGCGFTAILTAGGLENYPAGASRLKEIVDAAGEKIDVIACGGVRSHNVESVKIKVGATFFHSAAILEKGGTECDLDEVRRMWKVLK